MSPKLYVWQMIKEAVENLGGKATYSEIKDFIRNKYECVQKVTVSHKDRKIYVDLLLPDEGVMREIKKELKKHLVEEFESVKGIINGYGIGIEKIKFLETVSSGI